VAELNQKMMIGIVLILASLVLWFIPIVGCVLCNLSFLGGVVLIVLGYMEEQEKEKKGGEKPTEKEEKKA